MKADQKSTEHKEKKLLDPEKDTINVSLQKPMRSYIFIAKLILKKFGRVELHSLGKASESVVRIADELKRNNLASIEKIGSYITELTDKRNDSGTRSELAFRVIMKKSDKFDELTKELK